MQIILSITGIFLLLSFAYIQSQKGVYNYELSQNETVTFRTGPAHEFADYSSAMKRGAHDGASYQINLDARGNLLVSGLQESRGKYQSKLWFAQCSGTISRTLDTIKIHTTTFYRKFYLFNVRKNGIVDSFDADIQIALISRTLKNEYCPSLITTEGNTYIVALPQNVNPKNIYKAHHKSKDIGVFTLFSINDQKGKSAVYPAGDYVLLGGNSLKIAD